MYKKFYGVEGPARSEFEYPKSPKGISFNMIRKSGFVDRWEPITLAMNCEKFPDRINCLISGNIFSDRIKAVFDKYSEGRPIQWLLVYLKNQNGEVKNYYIPHIYLKEDLLDKEKMKILSKQAVVEIPVYAYSKINEKTFFIRSGTKPYSRQLQTKKELK